MKAITTSIFLCLILVLISNGYNNVQAQTLDDFTFSDDLDAPAELSWVLTTFSTHEFVNPDDYIWEPTMTHTVSLGDIFKIIFLDDPDNLNLTHYDELYTTSELWGHFYLNTEDLGTDASAIYFGDLQPPIENFPVRLIYPVSLQIEGSIINTFDYLYDQLKTYEKSQMGGNFKLTNNNDALAVELSGSLIFNLGFGEHKLTVDSRVIYNKAWGILSSYHHYFRDDFEGGYSEIELLFEITDDTLKVDVAYEWVSGLFVLFIAGVVILRRKRKPIYK